MHRRTLRRAGLAATVIAAALIPAASSLAAGNSVTATIPLGVRSVTVSSSAVSTTNCFASYSAFQSAVASRTPAGPPTGTSSSLGFPNGWCLSPGITVTNGSAAGHIDLQGSNGTAVGGTGNWTLVQSASPGSDQFDLDSIGYNSNYSPETATAYGTTLAPGCDTAFQAGDISAGKGVSGCTAAAGESVTEYLGVDGPSAQSAGDTATSETATATWTAVP